MRWRSCWRSPCRNASRCCAITAVAGNVPVAQTAANAKRITELAGHPHLPVYAGCAAPMVLPLVTAEFVCGPDGLAGADLPPPATPLAPGHAVTALLDLLRAAPPDGLTICALGPLTNIAMALRLAPELAERIASIVVMGGAMALGNITPAAEYNFYADPHAAAVVLNAGRPVMLLGLARHASGHCNTRDAGTVCRDGNPHRPLRARHADTSACIRSRHHRSSRPRRLRHRHPCVARTVPCRDCAVEIDTSDGKLRGRSTIDWHGRLRLNPNAHVIDQIDSPEFFARMIAGVAPAALIPASEFAHHAAHRRPIAGRGRHRDRGHA